MMRLTFHFKTALKIDTIDMTKLAIMATKSIINKGNTVILTV